MHHPRMGHCTAAAGVRIYIIGGRGQCTGYHQRAILGANSMEILNTATGEWTRPSAPSIARLHARCMVKQNELFLVGGKEYLPAGAAHRTLHDVPLGRTERLDLLTGVWGAPAEPEESVAAALAKLRTQSFDSSNLSTCSGLQTSVTEQVQYVECPRNHTNH